MILTRAYFKLGDHAEARFYLSQCHKMIHLEPYDEPSTNTALFSMLAELYMLDGDFDSARQMYSKYVSMTTEVYGPNHVSTSDCYNVISAFYTHRGQYGTAVDYCRRALAIRREQLGRNHRVTAESYYNLGLLYRLSGQHEDARDAFLDAREIRSILHGKDSLEVAEVELSLGFTEYQLGNLRSAQEFCQRSYERRSQRIGKNHPETNEALTLLDKIRLAQGGEASRSVNKSPRTLPVSPLPSSRSRIMWETSKASDDVSYDQFLLKRTLSEMGKIDKTLSLSFETRVMHRVRAQGYLSENEISSVFGPRFPRETDLLMQALRETALKERNAAREVGRVQQEKTGTRSRSLFRKSGALSTLNESGELPFPVSPLTSGEKRKQMTIERSSRSAFSTAAPSQVSRSDSKGRNAFSSEYYSSNVFDFFNSYQQQKEDHNSTLSYHAQKSNIEGAVNPTRRGKVVELSGAELWKKYDVEVFCAFGLMPFLEDIRKSQENSSLKQETMSSKNGKTAERNTTESMKTKRNKKKPRGPKLDTKRVHWDILEDTEGTIWDSGVDSSDIEMDEVFGDLKDEFSNTHKPTVLARGGSPLRNQEVVLIQDSKRRQNMSIFAKTLVKGGKNPNDIAKALVQMDLSPFGAQALDALLEFLPETQEAEAVQEYINNGGYPALLGPAEKFVAALADVPRLPQRVKSLSTLQMFEEIMANSEAAIRLIEVTSAQIKDSTRFARLLNIILRVGNELNKGTHKEDAQGVKLSSLIKLSQTKSNKNTTLMEYLVEHLIDKDPAVLHVAEDFPDLSESARCNLQTLAADVAKLKIDTKAVHRAMEDAQKSGDDADFVKATKAFVERESPRVEKTEAAFTSMKETFADLCKYLGENPAVSSPEEVFDQLQRFISSFHSTVEKVKAKRDRLPKRSSST